MQGRGALAGLPLDEFLAAFSLPIRLTSRAEPPADLSLNLAPQSLERFFLSAMTRLLQAAARGEQAATAALSLARPDPEGAATLVAAKANTMARPKQSAGKLVAGDENAIAPEDTLVRFLHWVAEEEFGASRAESAAILLSSLLFEDELGPDPTLGLAICAVRLGRLNEAFALATESLRRGSKHPRAFCIAGLCELDRGDRGAAQHHLAIATRVARSRPEFRDDMRMAQRLLLILNFGWKKPPRQALTQSEED
jgi:hypothetical protein